jgi:uncharacterized protein
LLSNQPFLFLNLLPYDRIITNERRSTLNYPKAYVSYLVHFHGDRDYFECHEILEDHWKQVSPRDQSSHWVGLIQIAVALYHERRGNRTGAIRMITKAINILSHKEKELQQLGLDPDKLLLLLKKAKQRMSASLPYENMNLPLTNEHLIIQCKDECKKLRLLWCHNNSVTDPYLINKHMNRDRSGVLLERERQLKIRALRNRG